MKCTGPILADLTFMDSWLGACMLFFLQQLTTHAQKVCICLVPVHLEPDAFVNSLSPNQRNTMPHQDFEFLLLVYHLTMPFGDRKLSIKGRQRRAAKSQRERSGARRSQYLRSYSHFSKIWPIFLNFLK